MDNTYNLIKTLDACNNVNKINSILINEKLENIYKRLFILLNNTPSNKNLLLKIWIDYLNFSIKKFINTLNNCEYFLNNNQNIDNKIVEILYYLHSISNL